MVQDSSSPVLSIMDSEQGRQTPTTQSSNEPATVNQRQVLLDGLIEGRHLPPTAASAVASFLLFGPQQRHEPTSRDKGMNQSDSPTASESYPILDDRSVFNIQNMQNAIIGTAALRKAIETVNQMERQLVSVSSRAESSLLWRELLPVLQDVGILLSLCADSAFNCNAVNISDLLALVLHLFALSDTGLLDIGTADVLTTLTLLIGGIVSSHRGIQELCLSFEDLWLEKMWFECALGDSIEDYQLVGELRRRPGVLSLTEEVRNNAYEMQISPSLTLSKMELVIITATLLDAWRTADLILQLQLGDLSHIRRNSDTISRACLNLARLCTYTCGREALCAVAMDTALPMFLIALERHSVSPTICETTRYLAIQLFHTALQYRLLLSVKGEDALNHLYRNIEPLTIAPTFFDKSHDSIIPTHINVLLEFVDHPQLLLADTNYPCQLATGLSTLTASCSKPRLCGKLISHISDLRLPYSTTALICAALDEVTNTISILIHGEELPTGYLRYAKPPFPIVPIEQLTGGSKVAHHSDSKSCTYRIAICLCEILLDLLNFQSEASDVLEERSLRYIVKSCIRAIQVSRNSTSLSFAGKLQRRATKILSQLVSVGFPSDVTITNSTDTKAINLVFHELLKEGSYSPGNCSTSLSLLSLLTATWKSSEILVNNRLVNTCREVLDNLGPELADLLMMWEGDYEEVLWLFNVGEKQGMLVWDEILTRLEFWMMRGHSTYTLKWLVILRRLLAEINDRRTALLGWENVVSERDGGQAGGLPKLVARISDMLPDSEMENLDQIKAIYALCTDLTLPDTAISEYDVEDLIHVNTTDYLEDMNPLDAFPSQRPSSPTSFRGRLSPETSTFITDDLQKSFTSSLVIGGQSLRNGGGGKIYTQNEFRSAHGTSRNTSRAPSVHVDDFLK